MRKRKRERDMSELKYYFDIQRVIGLFGGQHFADPGMDGRDITSFILFILFANQFFWEEGGWAEKRGKRKILSFIFVQIFKSTFVTNLHCDKNGLLS